MVSLHCTDVPFCCFWLIFTVVWNFPNWSKPILCSFLVENTSYRTTFWSQAWLCKNECEVCNPWNWVWQWFRTQAVQNLYHQGTKFMICNINKSKKLKKRIILIWDFLGFSWSKINTSSGVLPSYDGRNKSRFSGHLLALLECICTWHWMRSSCNILLSV